jgi:hypothetical protein
VGKGSGAVHVAKVVRKYKDREYVSWLLRRTYRRDGKVCHETLGNISSLPDDAIEVLRASLAGKTLVAAGEGFEIVRSLPHGHVAAVWSQAKTLGFADLLGSPCVERDIVMALVIARVCRPASKLATTRWWQTTTLAPDLGVADTSTDQVYTAMDWLASEQATIESRLARRHLSDGDLVFYDLSSSWMEGAHCSLAARGYSRDHKMGRAQIEYGLMTDGAGRPIAVEVFAGNTADPTAFVSAVEIVRTRFGLSSVVMVGDRGMITSARIEAIRKLGGLGWITSLRAPAVRALAEHGVLQLSLFDETNLAEITDHPDYPNERLIACRNPALAAARSHKREELLAATEKLLEPIVTAVGAGRLVGADKIGLRIGKIINRHKMSKHFTLTITDSNFTYTRNTAAIETEAGLDRIYIVRTSLTPDRLDGPGIVDAYKNLKVVEANFRSLKAIDLDLRPIRHWTEPRVRAHVFICMLAAYLVWHLRQAWAPICFTDEHPPDRPDPVAPKRRSPKATKKASTKRGADNQPAHSLPTLLDELATLTRNQLRTGDTNIEILATPTPLQHKAFELIGTTIPHKLT